MSLKELYLLYKENKQLKVRFKYWDHSIKYFSINEYDETLNVANGKLDSGEEISYDGDILDWDVYHDDKDFYTMLVA